jgi:hypothetical protein
LPTETILKQEAAPLLWRNRNKLARQTTTRHVLAILFIGMIHAMFKEVYFKLAHQAKHVQTVPAQTKALLAHPTQVAEPAH